MTKRSKAPAPGSVPLAPDMERAVQLVLDGETRQAAARECGVSPWALSRGHGADRLRYLARIATQYAGVRASEVLVDLEMCRQDALVKEDWHRFMAATKMLLDRLPAPTEDHPDQRVEAEHDEESARLPADKDQLLAMLDELNIKNGTAQLPADIQDAEFEQVQ